MFPKSDHSHGKYDPEEILMEQAAWDAERSDRKPTSRDPELRAAVQRACTFPKRQIVAKG